MFEALLNGASIEEALKPGAQQVARGETSMTSNCSDMARQSKLRGGTGSVGPGPGNKPSFVREPMTVAQRYQFTRHDFDFLRRISNARTGYGHGRQIRHVLFSVWLSACGCWGRPVSPTTAIICGNRLTMRRSWNCVNALTTNLTLSSAKTTISSFSPRQPCRSPYSAIAPHATCGSGPPDARPGGPIPSRWCLPNSRRC